MFYATSKVQNVFPFYELDNKVIIMHFISKNAPENDTHVTCVHNYKLQLNESDTVTSILSEDTGLVNMTCTVLYTTVFIDMEDHNIFIDQTIYKTQLTVKAHIL